MRVCMISPEYLHNWGGIGTYVQELASNLGGDFEVHVVTMDRKGPGASRVAGPPPGVTVHYLGEAKDTFIFNSKFQIDMLRKFNGLDSMLHFDILHANHAQMPDLFLRLLNRDPRAVTTVHTTIDSQRMGTASSGLPFNNLERSERMTYLMLPLLRCLEKEYLRRTTNVIFVSEFIRELFLKGNPAPSRSRVIHNGVDEGRFRPRAKEECVSRFPALADKENVVLFSGRLIALKGLETAIRAHALIASKANSHLVLAGAGNPETWKAMLVRSGVPRESYTFLGAVPYQDMPYLYPIASAFILPSYSDSFPMTLLEALSCGVPSVASAVGGVPEMVREGIDGLLMSPGDGAALASSILLLLDDERRARQLSENARQRVLSEFGSSVMARRTAEVYREVQEEAS